MIDLQKVLEALSSPVRREILWLVWDAELPAGAISTAFELTSATISEHLATLRAAGLVTMRPAGTYRYYQARREVLHGLQALLRDEGTRWINADDLPERAEATARTGLMVIASTEVPTDPASALRGFTEPQPFSRWLGVPMHIDAAGNFACTLEWGTAVRGRYTEIHPPSLVAFRWDFEDGGIPFPGGELEAYMRFTEVGEGCRVVVHQVVADEQQARFMEKALSALLGRMRQGLAAAVDPTVPATLTERAPRPKHLRRDRDVGGRARNARPRDALGRPLPRDAQGVPRQPEGVQRTPQETLDEAQALLDGGQPFHAHEVLEDAWKGTEELAERGLWKGLTQLAVGLTHAARGNATGAAALLRRGAEHLTPYLDSQPHGIDVAGLLGWANGVTTDLDRGADPFSAAQNPPRLRA
jgi:DNA-binding transcriptional ArsR family regulator/uncharacterized protein YndB with AHSA1/START domain